MHLMPEICEGLSGFYEALCVYTLFWVVVIYVCRGAPLRVEGKFWQFARQAHGIFHYMVEYWRQFGCRKQAGISEKL